MHECSTGISSLTRGFTRHYYAIVEQRSNVYIMLLKITIIRDGISISKLLRKRDVHPIIDYNINILRYVTYRSLLF